jgi:hypothetical protein
MSCRTNGLPLLRLVWGVALVGTSVTPVVLRAQPRNPTVESAVESISPEGIFGHIAVLAHDQLRGRDTPSEGLETAARYIADLHESYGLRPAGTDGTFYQRFPFGLVGPDPGRADIAISGPAGTKELAIGNDLFFDGGSDAPVRAPLVFVDPEQQVLPPGSLDGRVAVFVLPGAWSQSLWLTSLEQAAIGRGAGAVAIIHLLESNFAPSTIAQLGSALTQPRWQLGGDAFLPRLFIRRSALEDVFPEDDRPWLAPESTPGDGPIPVPQGELRASLPLNTVNAADPPNVIAELPGADPVLRDEYVVLTAHFDHVGIGRAVDGDSIYNGADDNGSGTAALLEVARALGSLPAELRPRRTVLFAHVSGEEKGLLGSEWWVDHPTRTIENVVANINTDMVGGDTHPDTVAVLGNEYSSLGPLIMGISRARPELRLTTVSDMWPEEGLFFRSDQFNFMRKEIPSLFVFAGLHECYHRPCDELDFVNPDKIARVARLIAYTTLEVANQDSRPEWDPSGLEEVRRMTSGVR